MKLPMNTIIGSQERFRRSFVLVMTLGYAALFLALISGFVEALLLAAVFSGIVYPLYTRLQGALNNRNGMASAITLLISLIVIIVPLVLLLGLIAEQAVKVADEATPWIETNFSNAEQVERTLVEGVPFADKLVPYGEEIAAKLAEISSQIGAYLADSLARLSQGTMAFFMSLFIMLYAMFFFLLHGPKIIENIMGYAPLSEDEKTRMLQVGLSVSRATVKGTVIIGIIQGTLGGIGFAAVGIDAAVFWGALMAVLSILPGIGTTLVWAPAVAYLLLGGETVAGLGLLVWSAGLVGTIDNVLRPRLVGKDTEMPDLLTLLSTLGGLSLFGASGLVLGPVVAALFMAVLAIYSSVFADWLSSDKHGKASSEDQAKTT